MTQYQGLFLAGQWRDGTDPLNVINPYNDEIVMRVGRADPALVEEAIAQSEQGFAAMRGLASYRRAEILKSTASGMVERREEFARAIVLENGKTIRLAQVEVDRAIHTFTLAAEEATRIHGDIQPLDLRPGLEGRMGLVRRVPLGPVLGISPFNFPLNLVAHKVAPALAAGCAIVLKPASRTPTSALLLAQVLHESGLPDGGLSVLPCRRQVGDLLVQDDRFRALSFTGSPEVGFGLKKNAGKKPVVLELGGNAAAIVHHDADVGLAVRQCLSGAFAYSGQVCISVQRIFLHESIADDFTDQFVPQTRALTVGDPLDPDTDVGPMIDRENIERIMAWIEEARAAGAEVLCGGTSEGSVVHPTVLANVDPTQNIDCGEAFGPTVNLHRYAEFEDALTRVNQSRYGLQAGLFTRDLDLAMRAFDELCVGGIILNDAPTFRVDSMPYGGTKDSGLGREGVTYAIEHFTEPRLLVVGPSGGV